MRNSLLLIVLISFGLSAQAETTFTQTKAESIEKQIKENQKETKKIEKELKELQKEREKELKQKDPTHNQNLNSPGQESIREPLKKEVGEGYDTKIIKLDNTSRENQKQKPGTQSKTESQKKRSNKSTIEKTKQELKESEEKALEFILPSIETESSTQATSEKFFSKTEKEQLLELWRATLARNRTIQFIIKNLSSNPDQIEKNNAVLQVLSKALFVPFYAASAVTNNTLISGGSAVGARVIGDVVDSYNGGKDQTRQITRTDTIVLFMLVDEVAERLRRSYASYKEAKVQKELISYELKPARLDASEAINGRDKSSMFFTRMVVRDLERRLRQTELSYQANRRTLVELAGDDAVNSVDILINLEVEEILSDIVGV